MLSRSASSFFIKTSLESKKAMRVKNITKGELIIIPKEIIDKKRPRLVGFLVKRYGPFVKDSLVKFSFSNFLVQLQKTYENSFSKSYL